MIFAFDDEIWKSIINGAYGLIGLIAITWINRKLNTIQTRQVQNSVKIDLAASKADIAAKKAAAAAEKVENTAQDILQVKELAVTSVGKMDEVQRSTNGIKDQLVEEARKAALAEGIALGRAEARTRSTDKPSSEIKEH